jgi:hypothetical protein
MAEAAQKLLTAENVQFNNGSVLVHPQIIEALIPDHQESLTQHVPLFE